MSIVRQPSCERGTVKEHILLASRGTLQLLIKSIDTLPKLQHFLFFCGEVEVFALHSALHGAGKSQLLFTPAAMKQAEDRRDTISAVDQERESATSAFCNVAPLMTSTAALHWNDGFPPESSLFSCRHQVLAQSLAGDGMYSLTTKTRAELGPVSTDATLQVNMQGQ